MNELTLQEKIASIVNSRMNKQLKIELIQHMVETDYIKPRADTIQDAFENGYHARDEGTYPDMTYEENVKQAYNEWIDDV